MKATKFDFKTPVLFYLGLNLVHIVTLFLLYDSYCYNLIKYRFVSVELMGIVRACSASCTHEW